MKKVLWPALAVLFPFPLIWMYFQGDFSYLSDPYSLSMVLGLMAYCYFLVTLLISSRIPLWDRIYGHDRVMKFHSYLATSALVLAVLHRSIKLMVIDYSDMQQYFGVAALLIFASIAILTILIMVPNPLHRFSPLDKFRLYANTRLKLDYSILKKIHNFTVLVLILLSVHVLLAYSTLETWSRMISVSLLSLFVFSFWIRHKLIRPFINSKKGYKIHGISEPGPSLIEVRIAASEQSGLPAFKAGQFAFFSFPDSGLGGEEHPFTISSAPHEEHLSFTAKKLGDFTARLGDLKEGMAVKIDGPYGVFSIPPSSDKSFLFLAGGIGITPFLSMLKDVQQRKTDVDIYLIWSVRNSEDMVYDTFFRDMEKEIGGFRFIAHNSGEKGHLSAEELNRTLGDSLGKREIYICGPSAMRRQLVRDLKSLGIRKSQLHFEQFSL